MMNFGQERKLGLDSSELKKTNSDGSLFVVKAPRYYLAHHRMHSAAKAHLSFMMLQQHEWCRKWNSMFIYIP